MHTLTTNPRVLTVYLPWLASLLAGALELEGVHRLRRAMFGVHPILPRAGWLLLCVLGMGGAAGLSYTLIYIARVLHTPARGYWLPWIVCLGYLTVVAKRERRTARAVVPDREDD
jgi:hypothetical protein